MGISIFSTTFDHASERFPADARERISNGLTAWWRLFLGKGVYRKVNSSLLDESHWEHDSCSTIAQVVAVAMAILTGFVPMLLLMGAGAAIRAMSSQKSSSWKQLRACCALDSDLVGFISEANKS